MKQTLILIFSLCVCLGMAGCISTSKTDDTLPAATQHATTAATEETAETGTETTAPSTTSTEQKAMFAISMPTVKQAQTAPDGKVIFTHAYQNLSLIAPDPEAANRIIVDFYNRTDSADAAAQIRSEANSAYTSAAQTNIPYWLQSSYTPVRLDRCILSLFGSSVSYTGGAHADVTYHSFNYDMLTGNYLTLSDILAATTEPDSLYTLVLDALSAQADTVQFYEGYERTVKERFGKDFRYDTDWYLSEDGLCFFFYPYDIAPYSEGAVFAQIPYSELTGVINDACFPPEKDPAGGSITANRFDGSSLDNYTQFAEIILQSGENKILLHTQGLVYHVRIEADDHVDSNGIVYPRQTVFYSYALSPGDAIMLEADLADTNNALYLTYDTGSETVTCKITTEDGVPMLAEQS